MIELVIGGARSGKSRYAQQQAIESGRPVVYIATAEARDDEMQSRITRHREDRPALWETIEEPIKLAEVIEKHNTLDNYLLVDCLTLWLTNILFDKQGHSQSTVFEKETGRLFDLLSDYKGELIMVTNEVGQGIVPMDNMARRFVDEAGFLHQKLATLCDRVVLISAGLPQVLK